MATSTTSLPTLSRPDVERLVREAASYLMLVDEFRVEGIEPAWGAAESQCECPEASH
jgi:hypothetical protein